MKRRVAAIALIFIGAGAFAFAQSNQQKTPPPVRDYNPAPVKNGKTYVATKEIIFDKANGTLRKPTAEETTALVDHISSLANKASADLPVTQQTNGAKAVSLQGRFGGIVLGVALADGTTEIRCVTTLEEALEFLGLEESVPQQ